jgi:hypothetical protein
LVASKSWTTRRRYPGSPVTAAGVHDVVVPEPSGRLDSTALVNNCLPKSAQPGATKAMQEIDKAEDRDDAERAIEAFAKSYGAKSRWRAITGAHLVALVRSGAGFENGVLVERSGVAA